VTDIALTCETVAEHGLVERYVAGRLGPGAEREAFEAHLLTCDACREEVRLGLTVRAEFASTASRRGRRRWLLGVGLAAAAGLATLVVMRRTGTDQVRPLGAVRQPPIYLGVPVRGTATPADSLFDAAMQAYAEGDYATTAARLDRALAAGVDSTPALFFLGASRLLIGQEAGAAAAFRMVIALGDTPYLPEAHYYLAKALLQQGKGDGALRELRAVATADSAVAASAASLADSISRLLKR
jgi:putative zinc finger protein